MMNQQPSTQDPRNTQSRSFSAISACSAFNVVAGGRRRRCGGGNAWPPSSRHQLPDVGRGHVARRHGRRRSRQADRRPHAGRLRRSHRRQPAPRRHRGMGPARPRPPTRAAGAAAARRLQHERKRHRRPADRHGRRSAEHPLRRRDGDQQGGQRVHRSPGALRSRGRGRLRHGRPGHDVHRRPRARQAAHRADGRPEAGGPQRRPRVTTSRWSRRRRSTRAIAGCSSRCRSASACTRGELARRAGDVPRRRSRSKRARWRSTPTTTPTRRFRRCAICFLGPAHDRRAEDADPDLRRVRALRRRR